MISAKQWIESYVNTHYREMAALDPNALLTKSGIFWENDGTLAQAAIQ